MAQVELLFSNIEKYGYPHACLYCCNDENPQASRVKYGSYGAGCLGLGCVLFFMGPIVWLISLLVYIVKRPELQGKSGELGVPVCQNCLDGKKSVTYRTSVFVLLGVLVIGGVLLSPSLTVFHPKLTSMLLTIGFLVFGYAALEFVILERQFSAKVVKSDNDRLILDLPNDEYPSIYQRHLDTALLYGSVETLGATPEDFKL